MVKKISVLSVLILALSYGNSQNRTRDSLLQALPLANTDTGRVWLLAGLCSNYRASNTDSSVLYGEMALKLARQIHFLRGEANTLNRLSATYIGVGDFPKALELQYSALKISDENNFGLEKAACMRRIGFVYTELKNYSKAIGLFLTALKIDSGINNIGGKVIAYDNLGMIYQYLNNADSALYYNKKAFNEISYYREIESELYRVRGDIELMQDHQNQAIDFYHQGIQISTKSNDFRNSSFIYASLATAYKQMNQQDSAIYYALLGTETGKKSSFKKGILISANLLAQLYDSANPSKALYYYKLADEVKESLFGAGNIQTIQALVAKEEERRKEIELAKASYQNRLKLYGLSGGLLLLGVVAFFLYRNNRQKQSANKVLQTTLNHLKSTQAQLIQSEKMASLGQLTAGIAHEIQNPLNFVNNFSDINKELLAELKDEMGKGNLEDAEAIANDVIGNEEKINQHGKRADAIVKGMLQHSQTSSGQKELIDINKLADEYLHLAYHGLRGKDKNFNAAIQTDFDSGISNIAIIPQDIGRVLLNLYNNGFYAVHEKAVLAQSTSGSQPYQPTLSVRTKKSGNKVEIIVSDNGNGIAPNIINKIFQPFFTTKPTGKGTGLGLSLSYDIVKAQGGELKVESKEGEFTRFTVVLPG